MKHCWYSISANGSADLRSPEKEVCFRSWDLANSQMCEVRVATSNICRCNPPNWCGKRSGTDFATSGNVLLKCGLLHLKFLLKTARSKKCFPLTKLIKKWRRKHFLRLNFTKSSTQEPSIPHFSNTMLCDVAIFHNFLFS